MVPRLRAPPGHGGAVRFNPLFLRLFWNLWISFQPVPEQATYDNSSLKFGSRRGGGGSIL